VTLPEGYEPPSCALWPSEAVERAAREVREFGYIDIRDDHETSEWVRLVVEPVLDVLREQGWTVLPPGERLMPLEPIQIVKDATKIALAVEGRFARGGALEVVDGLAALYAPLPESQREEASADD